MTDREALVWAAAFANSIASARNRDEAVTFERASFRAAVDAQQAVSALRKAHESFRPDALALETLRAFQEKS